MRMPLNGAGCADTSPASGSAGAHASSNGHGLDSRQDETSRKRRVYREPGETSKRATRRDYRICPDRLRH